MKKIIALAVAAVVAAPAMADMTIGGTYAFGYQATSSEASPAGDSGFGTDTASLSVSGSTELNGMTVKAGISQGGMSRLSGGVGGEDAYLSIAGDFGTVKMSEVESGSGIRGLGQAGAPVNNMEGEILGAAGNIALLSYTAPAMGPVTIGLSHAETTGMGTGITTSSQGISATISAGMLTAKVDYTSWKDKSTTDDRVRVSAKADLGMAAVGVGHETRDYKDGSNRVNQIVGVSAPVGGATVGLAWVATETENAAGASTDDRTGWTVGMSAPLGGNLSLSANYAAWEEDATNDADKTTVILAYSF